MLVFHHNSSYFTIFYFRAFSYNIIKKLAPKDNLLISYKLIFLLSANLPSIKYGYNVKFFRCSPTCQPTNWLICQIFMVSAHQEEFIFFQYYYTNSKLLCQTILIFPKFIIIRKHEIYFTFG